MQRVSDGARGTLGGARRGAVPVGWVLASGLVLGAGWAAGVPWARSLTDQSEAVVSGDAAYAVLALLAGVITAVVLALRPGRRAHVRLAVVLAAATVASALAWGVGLLLGAPGLQAKGVLLLWPLAAAVLTMLRAVTTLVVHGE